MEDSNNKRVQEAIKIVEELELIKELLDTCLRDNSQKVPLVLEEYNTDVDEYITNAESFLNDIEESVEAMRVIIADYDELE